MCGEIQKMNLLYELLKPGEDVNTNPYTEQL